MLFPALAAIVVLTSPNAHAALDPSKPLTVRGAIDAALSYDPTVRSARERVNESETLKPLAFSRVLPVVNAFASGVHRKDAVNIGNPAFGGEAYNAYQFGLQASQTLFDGGAFIYALRGARQERELRDLDVEIAERDVSLKVLDAFYTVLLYDRALQSLLRNEAVSKKTLATAQQRLKIGRSQLLDVLQAKTQLALLAPRIEQARTRISTATAQLASLMGVAGGESLALKGNFDVDFTEPKIQELRGRAARLPQVQRARVQVEQFDAVRGTSLARHWPSLNLTGNWSRSSFSKAQLLDDYGTAWSVGLQLTVPLFSGLSSVFERRQLASQEAQLEIGEAKIRNDVSLAQIQAEQDLDVALKTISSSKLAAQYAHESLQEAQREYRISTTDYLQLLRAEQSALEAELSYDRDRYGLIMAVAKYCTATGIPVGEFVKLVE